MTFENIGGLKYAYIGTRNLLFEKISAVNMCLPRKGFQIQGMVDISALENGIYILMAYCFKKTINRKLMIIVEG